MLNIKEWFTNLLGLRIINIRSQNLEAQQYQWEFNDILIKSARRLLHDFDHALDMVPSENRDFHYPGSDEIIERMRERSMHWRRLFYPDNGIKNYRLELYKEIYKLEGEIERLKKLCQKNNIDPTDPDAIPF